MISSSKTYRFGGKNWPWDKNPIFGSKMSHFGSKFGPLRGQKSVKNAFFLVYTHKNTFFSLFCIFWGFWANPDRHIFRFRWVCRDFWKSSKISKMSKNDKKWQKSKSRKNRSEILSLGRSKINLGRQKLIDFGSKIWPWGGKNWPWEGQKSTLGWQNWPFWGLKIDLGPAKIDLGRVKNSTLGP